VDTIQALETLNAWREKLSLSFTWLIHGSKVVYFFFIMFVMVKYGHIHLGRKTDKPEFSTLAYVSMIFVTGVGNTLLVYSIQEPLFHRMYHFFAKAGYRSQDEVDLFAINMTVVDWGLGCFSPYAVVAVAMSLAVYRYNLPPIFRSCFYPILGHYTWGWMGDTIDGFAIVVTLAALCTSLGVLAANLLAGSVNMGWIDSRSPRVTVIQTTIVWASTIATIASVTSGLQRGIKYLCLLSMVLAGILTLLVFGKDDGKFLLNLQVQEVGYYLQTGIFQLNFFTDAFGQLREGSGRAIHGKSSEQWWMSVWLNFGQCWW
jgi:choline-glycine betaine transporter